MIAIMINLYHLMNTWDKIIRRILGTGDIWSGGDEGEHFLLDAGRLQRKTFVCEV